MADSRLGDRQSGSRVLNISLPRLNIIEQEHYVSQYTGLVFLRGTFFLIGPFPDHCLLVPFCHNMNENWLSKCKHLPNPQK